MKKKKAPRIKQNQLYYYGEEDDSSEEDDDDEDDSDKGMIMVDGVGFTALNEENSMMIESAYVEY